LPIFIGKALMPSHPLTLRPRRAEQVPSVLCLDATPERDAAPQLPACLCAPTRSHPQKTGPLLLVPAHLSPKPGEREFQDNLLPERTPPLPLGEVRRNVEQGPHSWGCDREGARKHAINCGAASRSGVASKHNTLGTCSALRGRRVGVRIVMTRNVFTPIPTFPHQGGRRIFVVM